MDHSIYNRQPLLRRLRLNVEAVGAFQKPIDLLQGIPLRRFSIDPFHEENESHHGTVSVRHSYPLSDTAALFPSRSRSYRPIAKTSAPSDTNKLYT